MAYETVKEVLNHARQFHASLSDGYVKLGREADQERVQMLLRYMGRRENQLAGQLAAFEAAASPSTLNTWLTFTPERALEDPVSRLDFDAGPSIDEVVQAALRLDESIVDMYRQLASSSPSEEVRDVFESLLREEQQEENLLARMASDLERFI